MFAIVLAAALLSVDAGNPVAIAQERYRSVNTYEATVTSEDAHRSHVQTVRYFYRKPGFVRIEFIQPHEGAVLIYRPSEHTAWLWPFGFHTFPVLTLNPRNSLILDPRGHSVDRSDIGPLFANLRALQAEGRTDVLGPARIGGRETVHLAVTGNTGETIEGVHQYDVWLDRATGFPLKIISRDESGNVIETVVMDDVKINVSLPPGLFAQ